MQLVYLPHFLVGDQIVLYLHSTLPLCWAAPSVHVVFIIHVSIKSASFNGSSCCLGFPCAMSISCLVYLGVIFILGEGKEQKKQQCSDAESQ